MKKVVIALGVFAFLLAGMITVDTAKANDKDKVVYDDPPKAEKKSTKSCADYKSSCCSSKSASASESCNHKEAGKAEKASTETKAPTTTSASTKKSSPDKK